MVNEFAKKLKVSTFWVEDHVRMGAVGIEPLPLVESPEVIHSTTQLATSRGGASNRTRILNQGHENQEHPALALMCTWKPSNPRLECENGL